MRGVGLIGRGRHSGPANGVYCCPVAALQYGMVAESMPAVIIQYDMRGERAARVDRKIILAEMTATHPSQLLKLDLNRAGGAWSGTWRMLSKSPTFACGDGGGS